MREWFIDLVAAAVRRVVNHQFEAMQADIIASERRINDAVLLSKEEIWTAMRAMQPQIGKPQPTPQEIEKAIEARKKLQVPGLTPELDAQIDWDRFR